MNKRLHLKAFLFPGLHQRSLISDKQNILVPEGIASLHTWARRFPLKGLMASFMGWCCFYGRQTLKPSPALSQIWKRRALSPLSPGLPEGLRLSASLCLTPVESKVQFEKTTGDGRLWGNSHLRACGRIQQNWIPHYWLVSHHLSTTRQKKVPRNVSPKWRTSGCPRRCRDVIFYLKDWTTWPSGGKKRGSFS